MVIYADVLFGLNALIDYLLLLASARLAGTPLRRGRFLLAAGVGGIYAVCVFVPGFSFLDGGGYKLLCAGMMLLISCGAKRELIRQSVIFFALACALGGGIMAIGMMDGAALSIGTGVIYSIPDLKLVLLAGAACYAAISLILPGLCRHTAVGGELSRVRLELMGHTMELTALRDTGNTLTDPATGQEVPVAEGRAVRELFPTEICPEERELRDPVDGITRLNAGVMRGRFRLLPYRAVGVERGFLLGVKVDCMTVDDRTFRGAVIALSPTPVSDGGGYRMLMGGERI